MVSNQSNIFYHCNAKNSLKQEFVLTCLLQNWHRMRCLFEL